MEIGNAMKIFPCEIGCYHEVRCEAFHMAELGAEQAYPMDVAFSRSRSPVSCDGFGGILRFTNSEVSMLIIDPQLLIYVFSQTWGNFMSASISISEHVLKF
jgi:hypothetical protein